MSLRAGSIHFACSTHHLDVFLFLMALLWSFYIYEKLIVNELYQNVLNILSRTTLYSFLQPSFSVTFFTTLNALYETMCHLQVITCCYQWWIFGYIDVRDGCWRPNVLVTSLRCWWLIQDVGDWFNTSRKPHDEKGRQHSDSATNTWNQSPS